MEKHTGNTNTAPAQNEGATWGFFTPNQTTNSEAGPQIVSSGSEHNDTIASALTHTSDESTSVGVAKATPVTDEASEANDAKLISTTKQLLLEVQKVTAQGKKLKQVWLGENLKLTFSKGQPAKFVFVRRVTFGPKSVDLGKYGKVVFEDVRARAEEQNATMKVQLLEEKEARLIQRQQAKAAQPKEKSFKNETGFSSTSDFIKFLTKLGLPSATYGIINEIKHFILLTIFMPHRGNDLIKAHTFDFNLNESVWYVANKGDGDYQDNEILPFQTINVLNKLFVPTNTYTPNHTYNTTPYFSYPLFPNFSKLDKEAREKAIVDFLTSISLDIKFKPDMFINIFKRFVNDDGVFTEQFINKVLGKKKFSKTELPYYTTQRWSLMQWWVDNITNDIGGFQSSSDSIFQNPKIYNQLFTPRIRNPIQPYHPSQVRRFP